MSGSSYTIHQLPVAERPRERLMKHGPETLATAELIAIILGSGMKGVPVLQLAQQILACFGGLQEVADASVQELCQVHGLGRAKAIQLKAALSLGGRLSKEIHAPKGKLDAPLHVYNLLKEELQNQKQENFVVVLQDSKGCVITHQTISKGTLTNALVHPREVFYPAIRHKAASVILAHNHPSGDPTPSKEDFEVTNHLIRIGHLMGIPVNDHLVIGKNTYISLRQEGVCFNLGGAYA